MTDDKEELVRAQNQVIGILFEVVKRFQANSDLDKEYFELVSDPSADTKRLDALLDERNENLEVIGRLLKQLES